MAFESKSVTVKSVTKNANNVVIELADGTGLEFPGTWDEFVVALETQLRGFDSYFVACFALARWVARNPTGANPSQIVGKTATLNLAAANTANILTIV